MVLEVKERSYVFCLSRLEIGRVIIEFIAQVQFHSKLNNFTCTSMKIIQTARSSSSTSAKAEMCSVFEIKRYFTFYAVQQSSTAKVTLNAKLS